MSHAYRARIVDGTKIVFSYATAAAAGGYATKLAADTIREQGADSFAIARLDDCAGVLLLRDFPHFSVGVSEVHFIFGSTLFLIFGAAPAAFGLALGLLLQGMFFVPSDLPQYGMNVTTLLVPLGAIGALADRVRICGALRALGANFLFESTNKWSFNFRGIPDPVLWPGYRTGCVTGSAEWSKATTS